MTLPSDPLRAATERVPDAVALRSPDGETSYAQLDRRVEDAAAGLLRRGLVPGDRVALCVAPSAEAVMVLLAAWRAGLVAAPLSLREPEEHVAQRLDELEARLLITDDGTASANVPTATLSACLQAHAGDVPEALPLDRPATVVFTSGSTGRPKAAVHSLANHLYNAAGSNQNLPLAPGDAWLLALPLYHVGGLAILFRCLLAGATVGAPERGASLVDAIRQTHATHLSLVATQVQRLLRDPSAGEVVAGLRGVLLGGSAIPPRVLQEAHVRGLPVHTTYGLTEMGSQVSTTPPAAGLPTLLTSGLLLSHRRLRIDPDGAADSGGEILVGGRARFLGYLQPDGSLREPFTDDGFFRTRDRGFLDAAGRLHVTGRLDNQFVSGGENIQPEEIEAALLALGEVAQALVVPVPDAEFGERPAAFVQLTTNKPPEAEALTSVLQKRLARFKLPVAYLPWPAEEDGLKPRRAELTKLARKRLGVTP